MVATINGKARLSSLPTCEAWHAFNGAVTADSLKLTIHSSRIGSSDITTLPNETVHGEYVLGKINSDGHNLRGLSARGCRWMHQTPSWHLDAVRLYSTRSGAATGPRRHAGGHQDGGPRRVGLSGVPRQISGKGVRSGPGSE